MKKILQIVLIFTLLVLDWAALIDIAKGEPKVYMEYAMITLSVVIFATMYLVEKKGKVEHDVEDKDEIEEVNTVK